jgi:hypothetical protein
MLCGPALIESDSMADALRLLFADALRLNAERSSAALRLSGGTEKTPDAYAPGARWPRPRRKGAARQINAAQSRRI